MLAHGAAIQPWESHKALVITSHSRAERHDGSAQSPREISRSFVVNLQITPGKFVRYRTGPQQTTTGIVRGTAIDWQRPRLRQTLEIEAHEFV